MQADWLTDSLLEELPWRAARLAGDLMLVNLNPGSI